MKQNALITIEDLTISFKRGNQSVAAVNGVDLEVASGETIALIGESGSGKSVTLRAMLNLNHKSRSETRGKVIIDGMDVLSLRPRQLQRFRGQTVSMIFQEPATAFDPVYTTGQQITEKIIHHSNKSYKEARAEALKLFERVRIASPEQRLDNYPHELSGGMRQRAMIALALAGNPKVLLADEPTTALDATVQIQILLLIREIQKEFGLAVVFVTHDIGVAIEVSDRIAVMYGGRIVESGPMRDVIKRPQHPYTLGLLGNHLIKGQRLAAIPGAPPDPTDLLPGCSFAPRCSFAIGQCRQAVPELVSIEGGHSSRCIRAEQILQDAGLPRAFHSQMETFDGHENA